MISNAFYFDDLDVYFLANSLTPSQLRQEIHKAEVARAVAEQFKGTPYETPDDLFPYSDYTVSCVEAINLQQASKPALKTQTGRVDIQKTKESCDIVTVIGKYTRLRKVGDRFIGCCPIHQDRHPSLTVYPAQGSWYCFGCNRGGDAIDFVMMTENFDLKQAITRLEAI